MSDLNKFIRASDRVVEFHTYYWSLTQEEHTPHSLEVQRDEIIHLWDALRVSYDSLLAKMPLKEEVSLETIKNKYFAAYSSHLKTLSNVNELLTSFTAQSTPSRDESKPINTTVDRFHLPPCDMDTFHGDYDSWPSFRDQFSALYGDQSHISPVEKLCHLLKKTKGEAHDIVKSCPFTNAGFRMAWENLIERYENKRVLVNAQLKTLFSLSPITKEAGPSIKAIQRTINNCVSNLTLLDINTNNWDVIFIYICSTCLPDVTLNLWEQSLKDNKGLPTWKDMDTFLSSRFNTLESVCDIRSANNMSACSKRNTQSKTDTPRGSRKINTFNTNISQNKTHKCSLCQESHPLRLCPRFLAMSVEKRFAFVKEQNRCTNCLATSHDFKKCKSQFVCSTCKQKHHSLLHRTPVSQSNSNPLSAQMPSSYGPVANSNNLPFSLPMNTPSTSAAAAKNPQSYSTHLQTPNSIFTLLGTALVTAIVGDLSCTVRALIDPASEASFISRSLQRKLSLPVRSSHTNVVGLSGSIATTSSQIGQMEIRSSLDPKFSTQVDVFVVENLTGALPNHPFSSLSKSEFSDLPMADSTNLPASHVDLLLGGDIYPKIIREGIRWNKNRTLIAQQSVFGWIITGQLDNSSCRSSVSSFFNKMDVNNLLTRFWELEEVPSRPLVSEDDKYCEELYQKTTYRNPSGRFVVSLPFVRNFPSEKTLGQSRNSAMSQFMRNETRLSKDLETKSKYDDVILEYLTLDHMKSVTPDLTANPNSYYLPHHAVLKPDSTTTKLRVVFNASCPSSNGVSLNDILYPGPVLQADLPTLIIRWRFFKYVFNADIEKMYRQILVNPHDTPFQRILFRNSPRESVTDFELKTVTFGVNCAPYLAIRTLLELANQCEQENPHVSNIIRNYMYVDDVLFGSHSINDAIKTRNDLIDVFASAGFSLRKWTANNSTILHGINPENLLNESFLTLSDTCTSKLLGLQWNAATDFFYFKPKKYPCLDQFTKRAVLSEIAKLFDPAGWLAPKLIVAKMLMQQIWKDDTDWDEIIKPSTLKLWKEFLEDYPNIEKIKIPRFVNYHPNFSFEIHGFCDASEKAYAAALYIRSEAPDGQAYTHLLSSKTKVAPVKYITLPRKELCGAELLAKMVQHFQTQLLNHSFRSFMWTDSTIVLAWLQKPSYTWNTFVANRTSSILEKTKVDSWSHIDSKDNPADLASRGCSATELAKNQLWWHGPSWLKLTRNCWPSKRDKFDTDLEKKPVRSHVTQTSEFDILNRFSDLPRAMRVISYVFRFLYNTCGKYKGNHVHTSTSLQQSEIQFVKSRLILLCQRFYFPEYDLLSRGSVLSKKSPLISFNPFIDSNGFIRANGRLSQSPVLTYSEKFPIILPYSGRFTRLYLEMLHKCSIHGGNSLLMRLMRIEFWVPKLKNLIKTVIHSCKSCVLYRHRQSKQIMSALPAERTMISRPFTHTGVDFAGPFDIKSYVGRGCKMTKGYVLVFVCFSTKAIHLELTSEISTNAFLAAFSRFFSRRGCPTAMYSDNGTAFVGAANVLSTERAQFLTSVRQQLSAQHMYQNIGWHFIPPGAPHMGGLWEAGVKSFKSHLKKISNAQKFTYEEFETMLIRIEACLNSRPLCPINDNPSELNALTPGHFLIGTPLLSPAESIPNDRSLNFVNRWRKLKILHHHFALLWKEEYLKELHKRTKWQFPERDFAPNDLVVIRRENLPPSQWQLGRIEKVLPGTDGKVRVAQIRTARGLILRPIVKLVLLPSCESN